MTLEDVWHEKVGTVVWTTLYKIKIPMEFEVVAVVIRQCALNCFVTGAFRVRGGSDHEGVVIPASLL